MVVLTVLNFLLGAAIIGVLLWFKFHFHWSFSRRVLIALAFAIIYGFYLHQVYGPDNFITKNSVDYLNIIGGAYVNLLQMIAIPLIFICIVAAFTRLQLKTNVAKIGGWIVGMLVSTAALAGAVGLVTAFFFKLDAKNIAQTTSTLHTATKLQQQYTGGDNALSLPEKVVQIVPTNPFLDLTGSRAGATVGVVIFAAFLGVAYLLVKKQKAEAAKTFADLIEAIYEVIMQVVRMILKLTPYGVFTVMSATIAKSELNAVLKLGMFFIAVYAAIAIMFLIHLVILMLCGINPVKYLKNALPVLIFAFTTRSSAGALSMNIQTQESVGVPSGIAGFAASFGTAIGQNGCAGIYPAMLIFLTAPTVGVNPMSPGFFFTALAVIAISSFGVAGVGGGGTFDAIIVLSTLGLPVGLAGVMISIEPLIDMGRTTLNVNGSMVAGVVASKATQNLGELDSNVTISEDDFSL